MNIQELETHDSTLSFHLNMSFNTLSTTNTTTVNIDVVLKPQTNFDAETVTDIAAELANILVATSKSPTLSEFYQAEKCQKPGKYI